MFYHGKEKFSRLNRQNIEKYLKITYVDYENVQHIETKKLNIVSLWQDNYGQQNDCALVSITTCIYYWAKKKNLPISISEIYIKVEKLANKYFYNGKSYGIIPFFINKIYSEALEYFTFKHNVNSKYVKNIGYTLKDIKKAIDLETPVILSIFNDGRSYYKNHTVTVVGYSDFKLTKINENKFITKNEKIKTMLLIYDNWTADFSYLDLDKINPISAIQY